MTTRIDYLSYLESPAWRSFRRRALSAAGFACQRCGVEQRAARLEVHHKHYETLGNEQLKDVEVLCEACHLLADTERRRGAWMRRWQKRYTAFGRKAGLKGGAAELALATWLFETTP